MGKQVFLAQPDDAGKRLDLFLGESVDGAALTRSHIQKIIDSGAVKVNGEPKSKNYRIRVGDSVAATILAPQPLDVSPQNIPLDVAYEDDDIIVVDKRKGMVVHPAPGNNDGTLVNALLYHCAGSLSGINGTLRPGIVHRIDKDTSGLIVAAKNDAAHVALARQIEDHSMTREYRAVVHGRVKEQSGTINCPIGRDERDRKKFCVTGVNSKIAVTHYDVVEAFDSFTYIKCRLETGRTHQIRVHMAWLGNPVAGDAVYGPRNVQKDLYGQCLHAGLLGFTHPKTGEYVEIHSELPEYFKTFLNKLRG